MIASEIRVPILSNKVIKIKFGESTGSINDFTKRIDFVKGAKLISATLRVKALQTYLSGASLDIVMNGLALDGQMNWHALEQHQKSQDWLVSSLVLDGQNKFSFVYSSAAGVLSEQQMTVTAELILRIEKEAGTPGVEIGNTTETGIKAKVGQALREGADFIVAVGILGSVALAGGYLFVREVKK
jgi:hypothetical protein